MKNNYIFKFFIFCVLFLKAGMFAAFASELVEFKQKDGGELLVINAPKLEPRKVFVVSNPERLAVDIPSVAGKPKVALAEDYQGKLIKAARFGQFSPTISRFVFDLNDRVKIISAKVERGRLSVEIAAVGEDSSDRSQEPDNYSKKPKKEENLKVYKRKKGKEKPLIVIDAGHGGVDPGTIAESGTEEKDVVLGYALALKDYLLKTGKYKVKLTRSNDEFIRLRERVAIARRAGADLFISLHADSAGEPGARGLSVYTVSDKASDKEAEALAMRENKSDVIGGMDLSDERPEVADILISLAQRETKNSSAALADFLVVNLEKKVRMLPNSHRFAGFAVLKAPDIPSVLIEVGFLSHPAEEKELLSKSYRNKIIAGISSGVDAYFRRKSEFE